jgi:hypothetical protein
MGLIVSALVAVAGLLGLFHALIATVLLTCIRADPNMALISPEMDMLLIVSCLILAWILAFLQKDIFALRHVGTRFYGREYNEHGYITTQWLVAGFPLLPIRSYVIAYQIKGISNPEFEYQRNAMEPVAGYFHWPQMLRTALISYGTMTWCLGCIWLMFIGPCL